MRKSLLVLCTFLWLCIGFPAHAQDTTYEAQFLDETDTVPIYCVDTIETSMKDLVEYGNVIYLTTNRKPDTPMEYAKERYTELYGEEDGVLLLVVEDSTRKYACIYTSGIFCDIDASLEDITAKASDNVAHYDYDDCAKDAFYSIYRALP